MAARAALTFAVAGVTLLVACSDGSPTIPTSSEPFIYLVLSPEPLPTGGPPPADSSILALLLTVGSPARSPFRLAERFEIRSTSDGSVFRWQGVTPSAVETPVGYRGVSLSSANYVLKNNGSPGSSGANAIRPLASYDLLIETENRVAKGRITIPGRPNPRLVTTDSRRFVVFSPVPGAAAYYVSADTEVFPGVFTRDTVLELRYERPPMSLPVSPEFRVIAVETNLYRYLSDTTIASAGIEGGLGVFGGASSARIPLPHR